MKEDRGPYKILSFAPAIHSQHPWRVPAQRIGGQQFEVFSAGIGPKRQGEPACDQVLRDIYRSMPAELAASHGRSLLMSNSIL